MEGIRLKPTPLRVMRAFRWQRAFGRLMMERESMMTLKEMASLINDIAKIESDVYRPVTEEELKGLEDDPMHGMSDLAMMYVHFMRATSGIHMNRRDLGAYDDPDWEVTVKQLGEHRSDEFSKKLDLLKKHEDGEVMLTSVNMGFVGRDGVKRWVSVGAAALDDGDAMELAGMIRSALVGMVSKKARKRNAYKKRRRMFKDMRGNLLAEQSLRDMLSGKSEKGNAEDGDTFAP